VCCASLISAGSMYATFHLSFSFSSNACIKYKSDRFGWLPKIHMDLKNSVCGTCWPTCTKRWRDSCRGIDNGTSSANPWNWYRSYDLHGHWTPTSGYTQ
jgi:hypothetical protein